jgi:hypothetical protein
VVPAGARAAYREVDPRTSVEVDFGGGPATMGAATFELDLTGLTGPVRWAELDRLPRCTTLIWSGADRGMTAALAARPIIDRLVWRGVPPEVDLGGTALTAVELAGRAPDHLRLPRSVHTLALADLPVRSVAAADRGRWLRLRFDLDGEPAIPAGLHGVRELELTGGGTVPVDSLGVLTDLESLRITWRAEPGRLTGGAALAGLTRLAAIDLVDGYAFGAGDLPALPALTHLSVRGIERSAAAALEERYRGSGVRLSIRRAPSPSPSGPRV